MNERERAEIRADILCALIRVVKGELELPKNKAEFVHREINSKRNKEDFIRFKDFFRELSALKKSPGRAMEEKIYKLICDIYDNANFLDKAEYSD